MRSQDSPPCTGSYSIHRVPEGQGWLVFLSRYAGLASGRLTQGERTKEKQIASSKGPIVLLSSLLLRAVPPRQKKTKATGVCSSLRVVPAMDLPSSLIGPGRHQQHSLPGFYHNLVRVAHGAPVPSRCA